MKQIFLLLLAALAMFSCGKELSKESGSGGTSGNGIYGKWQLINMDNLQYDTVAATADGSTDSNISVIKYSTPKDSAKGVFTFNQNGSFTSTDFRVTYLGTMTTSVYSDGEFFGETTRDIEFPGLTTPNGAGNFTLIGADSIVITSTTPSLPVLDPKVGSITTVGYKYTITNNELLLKQNYYLKQNYELQGMQVRHNSRLIYNIKFKRM